MSATSCSSRGRRADPRVITLDKLIEKGAGADAAEFEARARAVQPDDLATFIYTSGTTGTPKGVMLTHGNIASNVSSGLSVLGLDRKFVVLSFLPLSHSFERTVDYCYFLRRAARSPTPSRWPWCRRTCRRSSRTSSSPCRASTRRSTAKVQEGVAAGSPIKQKLFAWAVGVGRKALPYRLKQRTPPGFLGIQLGLADKLVFSKIKARLGGRFVFAISGGAPLARDIAEFFWGAGVPIYEGYGLSETSPVISVNTRDERSRWAPSASRSPGSR